MASAHACKRFLALEFGDAIVFVEKTQKKRQVKPAPETRRRPMSASSLKSTQKTRMFKPAPEKRVRPMSAPSHRSVHPINDTTTFALADAPTSTIVGSSGKTHERPTSAAALHERVDKLCDFIEKQEEYMTAILKQEMKDQRSALAVARWAKMVNNMLEANRRMLRETNDAHRLDTQTAKFKLLGKAAGLTRSSGIYLENVRSKSKQKLRQQIALKMRKGIKNIIATQNLKQNTTAKERMLTRKVEILRSTTHQRGEWKGADGGDPRLSFAFHQQTAGRRGVSAKLLGHRQTSVSVSDLTRAISLA